jgi:hypothetical protein
MSFAESYTSKSSPPINLAVYSAHSFLNPLSFSGTTGAGGVVGAGVSSGLLS